MMYFISTPIGNLEDITLRALRILKEVDFIVCENTLHSKKLLNHYGIKKKKLISCNEYNEKRRIPYIIERLREGKKIAFITNAGSPIISDPGYPLIRRLIEENLPFTFIPGPSAVIAAVVLSGFPPFFVFEGFLPRKGRKRKERLLAIKEEKRTVVIFESPKRVLKTLKDMADIGMEEREVAIVREITKIHEEVIRGRIKELLDMEEPRGEVTLVIKGRDDGVEEGSETAD